MKKIFYRILENGLELYNLKRATEDSAGFDLVAAVNKKITLKPNTTKEKRFDGFPYGSQLRNPKSRKGPFEASGAWQF